MNKVGLLFFFISKVWKEMVLWSVRRCYIIVFVNKIPEVWKEIYRNAISCLEVGGIHAVFFCSFNIFMFFNIFNILKNEHVFKI